MSRPRGTLRWIAAVAVLAAGCGGAKTPAATGPSIPISSAVAMAPSATSSSAVNVSFECSKFSALMKGVGTAITTAESQEEVNNFADASKATAAQTIATEQAMLSSAVAAEPVSAIAGVETKVQADLAPIADPSQIGPGSISSALASISTDAGPLIATGGTCPGA